MRSQKFSAKPELAKSVTEKNARSAPSIHPDPISAGRVKLRSPGNCLPVVQIDFTELENGSLVEIIEAPADPNHTGISDFSAGSDPSSRTG